MMLTGKAVRRLKGSVAEVRGYALRLLNYRSRSRKEMLDRLGRKGFSREHIRSVMEFLERSKLINDEALASDLFRQSIERKFLGSGGVRVFLSKRGIPRELIDQTMLEHSDEMEEVSARRFIEKKMTYLKKHPDNIVKRRLWGMLQRRGYSISVITKVLKSMSI